MMLIWEKANGVRKNSTLKKIWQIQMDKIALIEVSTHIQKCGRTILKPNSQPILHNKNKELKYFL